MERRARPKLESRVALVTGAGRNLGRAIAVALAREGAHVALNGRAHVDELEATARECRGHGVKAVIALADVADVQAVEGMVREVGAALGPIEILVNNAALRRERDFLDLTLEDWDLVFATNVRSAFWLTRLVLPGMLGLGRGVILNVSGEDGFTGEAGRVDVATSKAAIAALTRSLSIEFGPRGIRVNTLVPGVMDTCRPTRHPKWAAEVWIPRIPLRRLGSAADVGGAAVFLASDEAAYITGHALHVSGGLATYA